jgi:hypothetical protein
MPAGGIPAGRAATRTPEPPDRDEDENSPPRFSRPKRTTKPPNNYAQEKEKETVQRNTRSQQRRKSQGMPVTQHDAPNLEDSSTESEEINTATLLEELTKLRTEISTTVG